MNMKKKEAHTASNVEISPDWLRKRKRTLVVFLLQVTLGGIENSAFIFTIWMYITTLVDTTSPMLVFSMTAGIYRIVGVIMTPFLGRIADRYRCVRKILLIVNTFTILGNILYCINLSPICLILGRLLAGPTDALRSVMSGEIARSFDKTELTGALSLMGGGYMIGFMGGPALNSIFSTVDFHIYNVRITAVNAAGFYLAIAFVIFQVVILCFASDLSKEFDLKRKIEEENSAREQTRMFESSEDIWTVTKQFFQNSDLLLAFWLGLLSYYTLVSCDVLLPVIATNYLHWNALDISIIILDLGVLVSVIAVAVAILKPELRQMHIFVVLGIICSIGSFVSLYCIKVYNNSMTALTLSLCAWVICMASTNCVDEIYLTLLVANVVDSSRQSFADSIRLLFNRVGAFVAIMSSIFMIDCLPTFTTSGVILWFLTLIIFLFKVYRWKKSKSHLV